ncbi:MAG: hypothetical protein AAGA65_23940, partial [Actinomycetota bacterium]
MTVQASAAAAGELLGDLSELYGWALTGTESALLRAAFAGRNRDQIAIIAADTAGPSKILTPEQLRQALTGGQADTTPARPGMPYHLPICQCGGAGAMRVPASDANNRPTTTVVACDGNRGRRITPEQWDSWQQQNGRTEPAAGKIPAHYQTARVV